ncbi:MAG: hypothetical protein ACLSVD_05720 [Eggerthellaceae bacterium]
MPYADSIPPRSKSAATEEPVVENGVAPLAPSDSNVNVNAPFNLASNVKYHTCSLTTARCLPSGSIT